MSITTGEWVGYGAVYLARDLGYFKDAGLDITITQVDDFLTSSAALQSGQLSGVAAQPDVMLLPRKNMCIKGVVALDDSSGSDGILVRNDIKDFSQLRGKEIAVQEEGLPNLFFSYALKQAGLTRNDVTILNMKSADAASAFIAGRVPVAVTFEPSLTFVQATNQGKILYTSKQTPGLISDFIFVRCAVIKQQPADVKALVSGVLKADDYIKEHPDAAYDIMRKYVGGFLTSKEDFAKAAVGVTYYGRELNKSYMGSREKPGRIMQTMGIIYGVWGSLAPQYTYDQLFDPDFIDH